MKNNNPPKYNGIVRLAIHPEQVPGADRDYLQGLRLIDQDTGKEVKVSIGKHSAFEYANSIDITYCPPNSVFDLKEMERIRSRGVVLMEPIIKGRLSLEEVAKVFCPEDSLAVIKNIQRAIESYIKLPNNNLWRYDGPVGYILLDRKIERVGGFHLDIEKRGKWREIGSDTYAHWTPPEKFTRKVVACSVKDYEPIKIKRKSVPSKKIQYSPIIESNKIFYPRDDRPEVYVRGGAKWGDEGYEPPQGWD